MIEDTRALQGLLRALPRSQLVRTLDLSHIWPSQPHSLAMHLMQELGRVVLELPRLESLTFAVTLDAKHNERGEWEGGEQPFMCYSKYKLRKRARIVYQAHVQCYENRRPCLF